MNNIEQYRKRFYGLMESTMGDVKPLINEQSAGGIDTSKLGIAGMGTRVSKDGTVSYQVWCSQSDTEDKRWHTEDPCYVYEKTPATNYEFKLMTSDLNYEKTQQGAREKIEELIDKRESLNMKTPQ